MSPQVAAVGQPLTMSVTVTHPPGLVWEPRSAARRHGPFDIDQIRGPETSLPVGEEGAGGSATTAWAFTLTAFELGELEVPPLELRYAPAGGSGEAEVRSVTTAPQTVVIEAQVTDPNARAADIRTGFSLPPSGGLVRIALAAAAVAALGALVWWLRRRRPRPRPAPAAPAPRRPEPPRRPAYERYMEELEALLGRGLPQAGRFKEFHILLAEIVKRYLGETFAFDAVDRTSAEVMEDLRRLARPTLGKETAVFLRQCDLVKFAEAPSTPEACASLAEQARRILDMGRPAASPPPGSIAARLEARA